MAEPTAAGSAPGLGASSTQARLYEENSSRSAAIPRTVSLWLDRRRRRRALQDLAERNDHLLADVGLTRAEALREAGKPFWQR